MDLQHPLHSPSSGDEPESNWPDFLLRAREELVGFALRPWAFQKKSLLEINCAGGLLQPLLKDLGFAVHGCEPSFDLRTLFCRRLGATFSVEAGIAQSLPFDAENFDYALLHLRGKTPPDILEASLSEASRVSRKGFAVSFWNAFSLSGWRVSSLFPHNAPENPWRILRILCRRFPLSSISLASALFGPSCTWNSSPRWRQLNRPGRICFGSLCILKVDHVPKAPLSATPIFVWRKFVQGEKLMQEGTSCQTSSPPKRA